jgi:CDP-diacylglycerol---serine O-phosphatidyltransferase
MEREKAAPSNGQKPPRKGLRAISLRVLAPNMVTLFALCAGLTSIRLAIEGRLELAMMAVLVAAILDGLDGRLARLLRGATRFGAELDSLSDFVNFGVAPALILYFWGLAPLKSLGWLVVLVFAMAAALRLARFNTMALDDNKPAWMADFFTGVPAPAGALLALAPVYASFIGVDLRGLPSFLFLYTALIAALMVSTLPTFSGKRLGHRIPRDKVVVLLLGAGLFAALFVIHTWEILLGMAVFYLALLPVSFRSYNKAKAVHASEDKTSETLTTS